MSSASFRLVAQNARRSSERGFNQLFGRPRDRTGSRFFHICPGLVNGTTLSSGTDLDFSFEQTKQARAAETAALEIQIRPCWRCGLVSRSLRRLGLGVADLEFVRLADVHDL